MVTISQRQVRLPPVTATFLFTAVPPEHVPGMRKAATSYWLNDVHDVVYVAHTQWEYTSIPDLGTLDRIAI